MSHQWSDFPSGQPGIYGTNTAFMLNGTPWVNVSTATLVADPDSANFPNGVVLRHASGVNGPEEAARLALLTPHQKVGIAWRFWADELPEAGFVSFIHFLTTGNVGRYGLRLGANGALQLVEGTTTELANTEAPVIFANSWNHLEVLVDVVTGDIEVRKNGVEIASLTTTDGSPPGGTIGLIGFPDNNAAGSNQGPFYSKDVVVYNGAGTQFNDFLGNVSVYDQVLDGDVTVGGWVPSTGSTAYNLIDETTPNDADYIQADDSPPAAAECTTANLPDDVTSVRCITSIVRAWKTDGGDGNLQISMSPNGSDYDAGADNPLTTSPTYYYDSSELSPATAAAWTPTEANSNRVQIDRTA